MLLTADQLNAVVHVLGEQLRERREALRWTREDLRRAMCLHTDTEEQGDTEERVDEADVPHTAIIATWERGSRNMTITRFVQVCAALEVDASEVLNEALARGVPTSTTGLIAIDRRKLARSTDPRHHRLRQWLAAREQPRSTAAHGSAGLELNRAALDPLAQLEGLTTPELIHALRDLHVDRS